MQSLETPPYDAGNCPSQRAIGMIADKWKLLILMQLSRTDVLRFKELQRTLGTVSQKVLTGALRELEADALVERTAYAEVPPRVEYRATQRARALLPILRQLEDWAAARAEAVPARAGATASVPEPAPLA
jgi:DNA-binding HxlR family transcriptional regulator